MTNLAAEVAKIRPQVRPSPVAGYEHVRGWGIYALPFDSGHVLALRVFPENDFAPYRTVWHRSPDGKWAIYYDAPRADIACPRYYGSATDHVAPADVSVSWSEAMTLEVEMDDPDLSLSATMAEPTPFRITNAVSPAIPEWVVRTRPGLAAMEWVASAGLDLGDVSLTGITPNGQRAIILPRQLFPVVGASAQLSGEDLGRPTRTVKNPRLGTVRLPTRPVLAIGRGYFRIRDREEYHRTLAELRESQRHEEGHPHEV